jgi:hypothetical protein
LGVAESADFVRYKRSPVHDFTPIHALVGGTLIALSLAIMLVSTGRIAGLSGVFAGRGTEASPSDS